MIRRANRADLELFARGASERAPSGHAAGQVILVASDSVVVDFGERNGLACFRPDYVPGVIVGDFVTIGPAVPRWRVTIREYR